MTKTTNFLFYFICLLNISISQGQIYKGDTYLERERIDFDEENTWIYRRELFPGSDSLWKTIDEDLINFFNDPSNGYKLKSMKMKCRESEILLHTFSTPCDPSFKVEYKIDGITKVTIVSHERSYFNSLRCPMPFICYMKVRCCTTVFQYSGAGYNRYSPPIFKTTLGEIINGNRIPTNLLAEEKYSSVRVSFSSPPYPNPAANEVKIDAIVYQNSLTADVLVKDLLGRIVYEKRALLHEGKNTIRIDVTDLNSGYYLYDVITDTERTTGRLSVKH